MAASGICSDLVVVELGDGRVASSLAGMILADNGARVLKVEPPAGDRFREALPSGWLVWNRGKESVVADLASSEGGAAVERLLAAADVVIDGLDVGVLDALGPGETATRARNSSVVWASITSFGPSSELSRIPADDALVMAKAGVFARGLFAFREGPIFTGAYLASVGAAHQCVSGIMAALVVRDRTGLGQRVDATLFQGLNPLDYFMSYHAQLGAKLAAQMAEAANDAQDDAAGIEQPEESSEDAPRVPAATRYGAFGCTRDGHWLSFSPQLPHQAHALVQVLELDWMFDDDRFKDMPSFWSLEDAGEWDRLLVERIKERDLDEWVTRGRENPDLPFEPILSAEGALDHPQLRHNGDIVVVHDPDHGSIEEIGPVGHFEATPSRIADPAPALDAHRDLPGPRPSVERTDTVPKHALDGITIVEFGYFYAMPYGVTMAASLGARVIKVENLDGDPFRWSFGPPEWGACKTTEGKESIALDVRTDEGRAIMHELLSTADVFVHGFRPGVPERLGLDLETVRSIKPDIVYLHGSGYGSDGPMAHRPIYAGVACAMSGSVHRQAPTWLDPEFSAPLNALEAQMIVLPRLAGVTDGDANAADGVMTALLLALRHRQRTGEGQFASTSMIGSNVLAYAEDFTRYDGKVPIPTADADELGTGALHRLYPAGEGWVFLSVPTQEDWEHLVTVLETPSLFGDPRFATPAARLENDDALADELAKTFANRAAGEWEAACLGAGVGCVEVSARSQAEVTCSDERLCAAGLVVPIEHPMFGSLLRYAPPAALSETPGPVLPGCTFAQHTRSILAELGRTDDEIAELAARGVVKLPDTATAIR
jgi:crotonobetainyl-CoA:carnitine CoA-transferase CaiB-like acyl-CoA transferase